jgi:hypothetical protein
MSHHGRSSRETGRGRDAVAKACGADVELGNFVMGGSPSSDTGREASRALLREVSGVPHLQMLGATPAAEWARAVAAYEVGYYNGSGAAGSSLVGSDPQDWGRKFLATNGGCVYIDLDHLEICLPEVISAYDHVAAWHAMLRVARAAQVAANAKLPVGQSIEVLANNSDGQSHSYGSHLSFLMTGRAWSNVFNRRLHYLLFLASFQASAIAITGQGKVGAENGAAPVAYQVAQRADFFEQLVGEQTTYSRPIVNARDEPLCGPATGTPQADLARLHCIFFDSTLCHVSSLLKVGMMQIVLAMIEAERVDHRLVLEDPVDAVVRWSHDPTLKTACPMVSGSARSILELQESFFEQAERFVADGGCEGIVPHASDILALWNDTLRKLVARDFAALAARLDWVLKLQTIERVLQRRSGLSWSSPEIKHIDHLYSSLDQAQGLYWAYEAGGAVERVVGERDIEQFVQRPPEDTRAWTRTALLRIAHPDEVYAVDWDSITFTHDGHGYWPRRRRVDLANPLAHTRAEVEALCRGASSLEEILAVLGATDVSVSPQSNNPANAWLLGQS